MSLVEITDPNAPLKSDPAPTEERRVKTFSEVADEVLAAMSGRLQPEGWKKQFITKVNGLALFAQSLKKALSDLWTMHQDMERVVATDHHTLQVVIRTLVDNGIITAEQLNQTAALFRKEFEDETRKQEESRRDAEASGVEITYPDRQAGSDTEAGASDAESSEIRGDASGTLRSVSDAEGGGGSSDGGSEELQQEASDESGVGPASGEVPASLPTVVGYSDFEKRRAELGKARANSDN